MDFKKDGIVEKVVISGPRGIYNEFDNQSRQAVYQRINRIFNNILLESAYTLIYAKTLIGGKNITKIMKVASRRMDIEGLKKDKLDNLKKMEKRDLDDSN